MLSGDPSLTLSLVPNTVGENAGPGAVTGTVTRNNMDTTQALTVDLTSSDTAHATVASTVTIPAGAASASFGVNPIDDLTVDGTHVVNITGFAASPAAIGLDPTFGSGGFDAVPLTADWSNYAPQVKVDPNGNIVGLASASPESSGTWAVTRALPNGTPDLSFGGTGTVVTSFPRATGGSATSVAFQPDGKMVVAGIVTGTNPYDTWGVARYNSDGTLDTTFGTGGLYQFSFDSSNGYGGWAYGVAVQPDGEILVGGMLRGVGMGFSVGRLSATGQLDTSFGTNGIASINVPGGSANAMLLQPDGKIVLTGEAQNSNSTHLAVARFTATGAADTTFNGSGFEVITSAYRGEALALQGDGKIVVAGSQFQSTVLTVRLNPDGSLDTSFNGTGIATADFVGLTDNDTGYGVAVQADGKILVGGQAISPGYSLGLLRYNADGTLDTSFNGTGTLTIQPPDPFEGIRGIDLQPDGKMAGIAEGASTAGSFTQLIRVDTGLLVASAPLSVTNTDVSAITAANDSYADLENTTLTVAAPGVLANDTPGNNTPLSAVLVSGPSNGTLTFNADGSFVYAPATGFTGVDSFTYYDVEGSATSNTATVKINVQTPVAADDGYQMLENGSLTVAAPGVLNNDFAVNSTPLIAAEVSGPSHGSLTFNSDGSFHYVPTAGFIGIDSFTYQDTEGGIASNIATVTIAVQAPVAVNDSYSGPENGVLFVAAPGVLGNDTAANSTPLTPVLLSAPGNGSVDLYANGSFAYTPNAGFYGTDSFTYDDTEGTAVSNSATVTLSVYQVPTATNDSYTLKENTTLSVVAPGVLANDAAVNATPLSTTLLSGPSHGNLTLNADGSFTYVPTNDFSGTDSFTYYDTEGNLVSNSATVTLTVTPVPVAINDSYAVYENSVLSVAASGVLANDLPANNTPIVPVLASGPSHGTLTLNANGSFIYTPANGFYGSDSFTYYDTEGGLTSNTAAVSITVNPVPIAVDDSYSTNENASLQAYAGGADSLSMVSQPGDYIGQGQTYSFTSATGSFSVNVYASNDNELLFAYQDQNPDEWWYLEFAAPNGGPLVPGTYDNAGRAAFRPTTQPGLDVYGDGRGSNTLTGSFVVKEAVYDAQGNVISFDATFVQHSEGAAPALTGEIKYNAVVQPFGVLANDIAVNSTPLTAQLVSGPSHGTLNFNADGSFIYTPASGFYGTDSFTYNDVEGNATSNTATVSINVIPSTMVGDGQGDQFVFTAQDDGRMGYKVISGGSAIHYGWLPAGSNVSIAGGGGTNTIGVVGHSAANTFTLSTNKVVVDGVTLDASGTAGDIASWQLYAEGGGDRFIMAGSADNMSITGGGNTTLDYSGYGAAATVNLTTGTATGTAGVSGIGTIALGDGASNVTGDGNTALVGPDEANTWTVASASSGTIAYVKNRITTTIKYAGMGNLVGGPANDAFWLSSGVLPNGTIDGGTGTNTLNFSRYAATFGVGIDLHGTVVSVVDLPTTVDRVTVTNNAVSPPATAGTTFANIQTIVGGGMSGSFTGPNSASTWNLSGAGAGSVGGIAFSRFWHLIGWSGSDTLAGPNLANAFVLTGAGTGTYNNGTYFSGMANLRGGTSTNLFQIKPGGSLTGTLTGGPGPGLNTLDYTYYFASGGGTGISIDLANSTASGISGGFSNLAAFRGSRRTDTLSDASGTHTWTLTHAGAGNIDGIYTFSSFENLVGSGSDTLAGPNAAVTWVIRGTNAGSYNTTTSFAGMANLSGGTAADTFKFANGAILTGSLNGGGGTNSVNYSAYTTEVYVNLDDGSATGVAGGADGMLTNIANATGGLGNNVLVGNGLANVLTGGKGRNVIIGEGGADTLTAGPGQDLLIAGSTSFDMDDANLALIAAEWFKTGANETFAQRVANLSGAPTDGYTGPYLVSDLSGSGTPTVFDDTTIDTLAGNTGPAATDWFFAHTSGTNIDAIKNKIARDLVTAV